MKTIKVNLYQYHELSDSAKDVARNWWENCNDFQFEWDNITEDAKGVGIKLTEWEYKRNVEGELTLDFTQVMANIVKEHGPNCNTYKTAKEYQKKYVLLKENQYSEKEELEEEFLKSILEDYRVMADKAYEYSYSEEALKESMAANEYTFLENGKRFN